MSEISRLFFTPSWLAELGPMFYALKEDKFTQRERRKQDKTDAVSMEEQLKLATEKTRIEEQEAAALAAIKFTPRSRIITPGRKEIKTPARRHGFGI